MRRLVLIAALAVAGCASTYDRDPPPPPPGPPPSASWDAPPPPPPPLSDIPGPERGR